MTSQCFLGLRCRAEYRESTIHFQFSGFCRLHRPPSAQALQVTRLRLFAESSHAHCKVAHSRATHPGNVQDGIAGSNSTMEQSKLQFLASSSVLDCMYQVMCLTYTNSFSAHSASLLNANMMCVAAQHTFQLVDARGPIPTQLCSEKCEDTPACLVSTQHPLYS